jgi:hypothetical protein
MVILITNEGDAYHRSNGMPSIFRDVDELEDAARGSRLQNWAALELSHEEAWHFYNQSYAAVYGWREGLHMYV